MKDGELMVRKTKTEPTKAEKLKAAAVFIDPTVLVPWDQNPRINDAVVDGLAKSIEEFGFGAPIVARLANSMIIAGHTRWKAATKLGLKEVPVRFLDISESQAKALALADNRLGEEAEWDDIALRNVLLEIQPDIDVGILGFDETQLAGLLIPEQISSADADEIPEHVEPRTKKGDLWVMGKHRLLCGDSTKAADVERVMGGERATLLWTDPPYNVAYVGRTKDALTIQNDSMSDGDFRAFLVAAFTAADAVMAPGAAFYVAYPDREGFNFHGAARDVSWKLSSVVVWAKDSMVLGRSDYHGKHEPILYGWKAGAAHHAVEDRTQTSLWEIPRPKRSEEHPTMKPVALVARAVQNSTDKGAIVLDVFGGSGTTLVACEETGRCARLVELDPHYCDVIVARWEKFTGKKATLDDRAVVSRKRRRG